MRKAQNWKGYGHPPLLIVEDGGYEPPTPGAPAVRIKRKRSDRKRSAEAKALTIARRGLRDFEPWSFAA